MLTIPHTISDSPSCFIDPFALIRPAHADAIAAAGAPLVVHRRDDVLDTRLPVGLFEVGMPVCLPITIQESPGCSLAFAPASVEEPPSVPASPRKTELEGQMRSVNYRSPLPPQPPTPNTQPSTLNPLTQSPAGWRI